MVGHNKIVTTKLKIYCRLIQLSNRQYCHEWNLTVTMLNRLLSPDQLEKLIGPLQQLLVKWLKELLGKYFYSIDNSCNANDELENQCAKGIVEFKNLRLKPHALQELGLPLIVRCCVVSYVRLVIPWHALSAGVITPMIVVIDGLNCLVEPLSAQEWGNRNAQLKIAADLKLEADRALRLEQATKRARSPRHQKPGWKRRGLQMRKMAHNMTGDQSPIKMSTYENRLHYWLGIGQGLLTGGATTAFSVIC